MLKKKIPYIFLSLVIALVLVGFGSFTLVKQQQAPKSATAPNITYSDSSNKIFLFYPSSAGSINRAANTESLLGVVPSPTDTTYTFAEPSALGASITHLAASYIKAQDFNHLINRDSVTPNYAIVATMYQDSSNIMAKIYDQQSLSGVTLPKNGLWFGSRSAEKYDLAYISSSNERWRGLSFFMYDTDGVNSTRDVSYNVLLTDTYGNFFNLSAKLYGTQQSEIDIFNNSHPYTLGVTIPSQYQMTIFMQSAQAAFRDEVDAVNLIARSMVSS